MGSLFEIPGKQTVIQIPSAGHFLGRAVGINMLAGEEGSRMGQREKLSCNVGSTKEHKDKLSEPSGIRQFSSAEAIFEDDNHFQKPQGDKFFASKRNPVTHLSIQHRKGRLLPEGVTSIQG